MRLLRAPHGAHARHRRRRGAESAPPALCLSGLPGVAVDFADTGEGLAGQPNEAPQRSFELFGGCRDDEIHCSGRLSRGGSRFLRMRLPQAPCQGVGPAAPKRAYPSARRPSASRRRLRAVPACRAALWPAHWPAPGMGAMKAYDRARAHWAGDSPADGASATLASASRRVSALRASSAARWEPSWTKTATAR